eukprot:359132-Chlamydomonas_euryale.AAC.5
MSERTHRSRGQRGWCNHHTFTAEETNSRRNRSATLRRWLRRRDWVEGRATQGTVAAVLHTCGTLGDGGGLRPRLRYAGRDRTAHGRCQRAACSMKRGR